MTELPHRPELLAALAAQRTERVLTLVYDERRRQEGLKAAGRFRYTCADEGMTHLERLTVLGEEYGEVCRALCKGFEAGLLPADELSDWRAELREELVQVAAVAVAWIEALE